MDIKTRNGWRFKEEQGQVEFSHTCEWKPITPDEIERTLPIDGIFQDAESLVFVLNFERTNHRLLKVTPHESEGRQWFELSTMVINAPESFAIRETFCNPNAQAYKDAILEGVAVTWE